MLDYVVGTVPNIGGCFPNIEAIETGKRGMFNNFVNLIFFRELLNKFLHQMEGINGGRYLFGTQCIESMTKHSLLRRVQKSLADASSLS